MRSSALGWRWPRIIIAAATKHAPISGPVAALMQTGLKVLTGAEAVISVAHYGPSGNLHGHTYIIRAWWQNDKNGTICVVEKQEALRKWALGFDHSVLPQSVSRGEQLAARCCDDLGAVMVEVMRPQEGLYAVCASPTPTQGSE
jgi:hypothetical protein